MVEVDEVSRRLEFLIERTDELLKSQAFSRVFTFGRGVAIAVASLAAFTFASQTTGLEGAAKVTCSIIALSLAVYSLFPSNMFPPGIDWRKFKEVPDRSYTEALAELLEDKGRAVQRNTMELKSDSLMFFVAMVFLALSLVI